MNTLSIFQQTPIFNTKPSSSCDQKTQTCYPTINHHLQLSTPSWKKLHAQAKGFGSGPPPPNPIQKKENAPKKGPSSEGEEEDDDDKIPSIVFDRIIRRILVSVGLPLGLGIGMLQVFSLLKENNVWDVPLWIPFITTFVLLGSSVLGVAYGSLSTSWDPDKKGSLLGFQEAKQNWDEMWKEDNADKNS